MGIIFLAGVYGVGKTTLGQHAEKTLGIRHITASSLIKAEKASAISDTTKAVANIEDNQRLLMIGLRKARKENNGHFILDGHFTLPNNTGEIEPVSIDVFKEMQICKVILLHDAPEEIAKRFNSRDEKQISPDTVKNHQQKEIAHATYVCDELRIPLVMMNSPEIDASALSALFQP